MKRLAVLFAAAIVVQAAVPSPESYFGQALGKDRASLEWSQVTGYFGALARTSDRILVEQYGKSVEGRPLIVATISSAENLRRLDHWRDIEERLADPRRTPEPEAAKLSAEGKVVVLVTCSIHSNEVASTLSAAEFAYRLITEDKPKFRAILDNVLFLLVPSLNPDGVDIVTRWYRKTLGTPFEGTSPPELYHKYLGHDNNRDWYMFTQPETRATIEKLHNRWHPQIVYDVHQQGAYASRIFVPPWLDPIDPNVDAILVQLCNKIGAGMAADLTASGRTGVAINALYDFWTPARHYQAYHGGLRILSESASARLFSPLTVRPEEIARTALGYNPRERSWNYLEPWLGGEWRLRDIIDDQLVAMESCLHQAAVSRADMLRSFYRINQRSASRTAPWAFVIPEAQRDPGAATKLLETLRLGMVEIERAPGGYVIRMQQPYSGFAKTLLERQKYPARRLYPGGPPQQPYDVTAHTLPLLMGVDVATTDTPVEGLTLAPNPMIASRAGTLAAADSRSWKAVNAAWTSGATVSRDEQGNFQVPAQGKAIPRPRVGLYRSYQPAIDEGWTRWLLEEFGFSYSSLLNQEITAGGLRRRFDAIVFPDQSSRSIREGYAAGAMPEEYTGGLGDKAVDSLRQFANEGGTLVFLNGSAEWAIAALGLPVRNVLRGLSNREYYCPGSLLEVSLEPHPLTLGMPGGTIAIWNEQSPAFEVEGANAKVLARYPASGVLASGWLLGEKYVAGKAALVDVALGKGQVILFGMRPQYRGQSYLGFKLFFNALLNR